MCEVRLLWRKYFCSATTGCKLRSPVLLTPGAGVCFCLLDVVVIDIFFFCNLSCFLQSRRDSVNSGLGWRPPVVLSSATDRNGPGKRAKAWKKRKDRKERRASSSGGRREKEKEHKKKRSGLQGACFYTWWPL